MSVEQNLELGGLKRQTGNGVHWTRERIYEYFRASLSGWIVLRIISPAANSKWWR